MVENTRLDQDRLLGSRHFFAEGAIRVLRAIRGEKCGLVSSFAPFPFDALLQLQNRAHALAVNAGQVFLDLIHLGPK